MNNSLISRILFHLIERVGQLSAQVEALETAVSALETDDENLKVAVGAAVVELKELHEDVKKLEESGAITPEQAEAITSRVNKVAEGLTQSTEALTAAK